MENWGLVTYKQSLVLFDEKTSGLKDKKRVAYGTHPSFLETRTKESTYYHQLCYTNLRISGLATS